MKLGEGCILEAMRGTEMGWMIGAYYTVYTHVRFPRNEKW